MLQDRAPDPARAVTTGSGLAGREERGGIALRSDLVQVPRPKRSGCGLGFSVGSAFNVALPLGPATLSWRT